MRKVGWKWKVFFFFFFLSTRAGAVSCCTGVQKDKIKNKTFTSVVVQKKLVDVVCRVIFLNLVCIKTEKKSNLLCKQKYFFQFEIVSPYTGKQK